MLQVTQLIRRIKLPMMLQAWTARASCHEGCLRLWPNLRRETCFAQTQCVCWPCNSKSPQVDAQELQRIGKAIHKKRTASWKRIVLWWPVDQSIDSLVDLLMCLSELVDLLPRYFTDLLQYWLIDLIARCKLIWVIYPLSDWQCFGATRLQGTSAKQGHPAKAPIPRISAGEGNWQHPQAIWNTHKAPWQWQH